MAGGDPRRLALEGERRAGAALGVTRASPSLLQLAMTASPIGWCPSAPYASSSNGTSRFQWAFNIAATSPGGVRSEKGVKQREHRPPANTAASASQARRAAATMRCDASVE